MKSIEKLIINICYNKKYSYKIIYKFILSIIFGEFYFADIKNLKYFFKMFRFCFQLPISCLRNKNKRTAPLFLTANRQILKIYLKCQMLKKSIIVHFFNCIMEMDRFLHNGVALVLYKFLF